jgi:hypothetical protein
VEGSGGCCFRGLRPSTRNEDCVQDEAKPSPLTEASAEEVMDAMDAEADHNKRHGLPARHEVWGMGEGMDK